MSNEALTKQTQTLVAPENWTPTQVDLLKRTICRGADDDEFALFLTQCQRTGLDPFLRQIHAVKRWDSDLGREIMTIQVGIDGFRLQAERSGKYAGQSEPQWCGTDGAWVEIWTKQEPPTAARVYVHKEGIERPFVAIAYYAMYVQTKKDGAPNKMWAKGAPHQLAKCAEALAFRKAFPQEMSGLYTEIEMGSAVNAELPPKPTNAPRQAPGASNGLTAPFGRSKGQTPGEMADKDLDYYVGYAQKAVDDPKKERYLKANEKWLNALLDEKARRGASAEAQSTDEPPHPAEQPSLIDT